MSNSTKQTHYNTNSEEVTAPERRELPISNPGIAEAFKSIRGEIDKTIKDTIQEKRRAKYLPKSLDIVTGSLPSDDDIAEQNSENAWKKFDRNNAIKGHLSSVAIGPMSGHPIRIIEVTGDSNPDAVEVNIVVHDGMSPDVAKDIGLLASQTDDNT